MQANLQNGEIATVNEVFPNGNIKSSTGDVIKAQDIRFVDMNEDEFNDYFIPLSGGKEAGIGSGLYETYGEDIIEVDAMFKSHPDRVWTIMDSNDDDVVIVTGYYLMNRIAYILTENGAAWNVADIKSCIYSEKMNEDLIFTQKEDSNNYVMTSLRP